MNLKCTSHIGALCFAALTCGCSTGSVGLGGSSPKANGVAPEPAPSAPAVPKICLNLVGGADTTDHPAVVLLISKAAGSNSFGLCSGTVVGHNAVLTAADCLADGTTGGLHLVAAANVDSADSLAQAYAQGPASTAAFHHGKWGKDAAIDGFSESGAPDVLDAKIAASADLIAQDTAVIVFDGDLGIKPVTVRDTALPAGAAVTLVGFGRRAYNAPVVLPLTRQVGKNNLSAKSPVDVDVLEEKNFPVGGAGPNHALAYLGDAGSPLLDDAGQIAGVFSVYMFASSVSAGAGLPRALSIYAPTSSTRVDELLHRAKDGGAEIVFEKAEPAPQPPATPAPAATSIKAPPETAATTPASGC